MVSGNRRATFAGEGGHRNDGGENNRRAYSDRCKGRAVFVEGEYWNATSDAPVEKGRPVQIRAVEGLTVKVKTGNLIELSRRRVRSGFAVTKESSVKGRT